MSLLGLDVGTKTVGIAMSDSLGLVAQPLETLFYKNQKQVAAKISKLVSEHDISEIVVGLPYLKSGDESLQAKKIKTLITYVSGFLKKKDMVITYWNEALTTEAAKEILVQKNIPQEKRKEVIDKMAAAFILQEYLEAKRQNKRIS